MFEVICNRRLERIIMGKEKILPLILCWSNWPSHWSMDACIEIKPTERLLRGQPDHKMNKLPNLKVIQFENESLNVTPIMLMSVIRYCGQSDTRSVKHVLAEFSSSQLFLYCKETHHLLSQYELDEIYWYVGIESGNVFQNATPIKCQTIVADPDEATALVVSSGSNSNMSGSTKSAGSTKAIRRHQQPHSSTVASVSNQIPTVPTTLVECQITSTNSIPALTFIERHRIKSRQSHERRNFGQTLVFNSWIELDQWIKGLLEASLHRELFEI